MKTKTRLTKQHWVLILLGAIIVIVGEGIVIFFTLAWYWAVTVFAVAFVCVNRVSNQQEKQRIEAHFSGRPALGEKEFGKHYFSADRAEIAVRLREILAKHVGMDISRMNPTDRFIEDLRMEDMDSMSTVEFVIAVEEEFGIEIPNSAAEKMTTFQSVVDYVAEAIKSKAN